MQSPPKFIPHFVTLTHMRDTTRGTSRETLIEHFECATCGEYGMVDAPTKLCRPCWRVAVLAKVAP